MLLVSQEEKGLKSRAVGGGAAVPVAGPDAAAGRRATNPMVVSTAVASSANCPTSWGHDSPPPTDLAAGETVCESLSVSAGNKCVQQYLIQEHDRVSWECMVSNGYTVDFTAKVAVTQGRSEVQIAGRRLNLVGVDRSRVITERSRGGGFHGFLDLAGEHAGCVGGSISGEGLGNRVAVLVLEVDNSFSYFAAKEVRLRVTKAPVVEVAVVAPSPDSCAVGSTSTQLLASEHPVPPPPAALPAAMALASLGNGSLNTATKTLQIPSPGRGAGEVQSAVAEEENEEERRLSRLRALLAEALRLCPKGPVAAGLREHIRASQTHLSEYTISVSAQEQTGGHSALA